MKGMEIGWLGLRGEGLVRDLGRVEGKEEGGEGWEVLEGFISFSFTKFF